MRKTKPLESTLPLVILNKIKQIVLKDLRSNINRYPRLHSPAQTILPTKALVCNTI